jgi:hypothetical protein
LREIYGNDVGDDIRFAHLVKRKLLREHVETEASVVLVFQFNLGTGGEQ